ncbi:MAG TPA: Rhs element Vgr protein, partial [Cytophagales bacterium]|nr:Rhs element Vgr protein [Cytophagales bacterium]
GLGNRFNGDAYLTAVRHEVGTGQWTTQVQFGMEEAWFSRKVNANRSGGASGLLPAIQGLHIGVVTQLEGDPDGEERILVNLPLVDPDQDGVWARIATLDAGDSRGT